MRDEFEDGWAEIRRCRLRAEAERYALVLAAMGIGYRLVQGARTIALQVPEADAPYARHQLALYIAENGRRTRPAPPARNLSEGINGALAYGTLLVALHALSGRGALGLDWYAAGMMQAGLVTAGEWWRVVTALGLHVDVAHLAGNIIAGGVFGLLVAQALGTGLGWFAILISGVLGNAASAAVQSPAHASVGASTAVFGALGILVALAWHRQATAQLRGLRRRLPLAAGMMLLVYLGVGGERTDVVAHVTGFVAGIGVGAVIAVADHRLPKGPVGQIGFGAAAALLFTFAWIVALG